MPGARRGWWSLLVVALSAVAVYAAVDFGAWRVARPVFRREVADGVADLAATNPQVLVLGSSHARTFAALGDELAARERGDRRLVAIPVEAGKFTSYRWVLEHRLRPLLDERTANGTLVRSRLARFVLVTEWWDSCPVAGGGPSPNLPSRAWHLGDFLADVTARGVTDYNRNYLQTRWSRAWRASALMQDRGHATLLPKTKQFLGLENDAGRDAADTRDFVAYWQNLVEQGDRCLGDREQMAAFRDILAWSAARGLQTTVVLFPRKPVTLTARARATTLPRFADSAAVVASAAGARLVDLTSSTPLEDDYFMADFDHVSADGNHKFARWALEHDLRFLGERGDVAGPGGPAARSEGR